jgi:hypothetical protein
MKKFKALPLFMFAITPGFSNHNSALDLCKTFKNSIQKESCINNVENIYEDITEDEVKYCSRIQREEKKFECLNFAGCSDLSLKKIYELQKLMISGADSMSYHSVFSKLHEGLSQCKNKLYIQELKKSKKESF